MAVNATTQPTDAQPTINTSMPEIFQNATEATPGHYTFTDNRDVTITENQNGHPNTREGTLIEATKTTVDGAEAIEVILKDKHTHMGRCLVIRENLETGATTLLEQLNYQSDTRLKCGSVIDVELQ